MMEGIDKLLAEEMASLCEKPCSDNKGKKFAPAMKTAFTQNLATSMANVTNLNGKVATTEQVSQKPETLNSIL